ncbi:MAG: copper resistance system multicopper oxidase [Pseudomonadota bacterium]
MDFYSRRQFVTGLAAGGVIAGMGVRPSSGSAFSLEIGELPVNFTGRSRMATVVNGSLPAPLLRFREGDEVILAVSNRLKVLSAIHWHGLQLSAEMDGVPGLSFAGIAPGGSYEYRFKALQSGTYWYHAHAGYQEQTGLYGPIIIDPRKPEPFTYDREFVVMFSDWSDLSPERIVGLLKKQSDYFNKSKTMSTERGEWARMRMSPTDRADVSASTYTYLVNGKTPAGNWTGVYAPGERIRLRFINAGAMTYFDVRIPGLKMTVVAADGQHVEPVIVDEFRLAVAETLDVIVTPAAGQAYTVFAQSMDRSGFARCTLAPAPGMQAAVPPLDGQVLMTMDDMGHGGMADMPDMPSMDHGSMAEHPATEKDNPFVDMQSMDPKPRLASPGIGLREWDLQAVRVGYVPGHKVLALADLRSSFPDPDGREPGRTIELHLTGHMDRYVWSFNGVKFSDATPLEMVLGERLRIVLVNDTMMEHPIHLHGMWSDVEDEDGAFLVRKHTVTIPPGTKRSYRVTADAPGRWAYHCHLVFHMALGMFREVRVT